MTLKCLFFYAQTSSSFVCGGGGGANGRIVNFTAPILEINL
jgi:hypothetical protein